MLKRVSAIALTVAMLLSMACTFSFASAAPADPMSLSVALDKAVYNRGDTAVATISVVNYVPSAAMVVKGTVGDAFKIDATDITVAVSGETEKLVYADGTFSFAVANTQNLAYAEGATFTLATVTLKLKNDYFTAGGAISVAFTAEEGQMLKVDETIASGNDEDKLISLTRDTDYVTTAASATASLVEITDKMQLAVEGAKASIARGEEFTLTVIAKNYQPLVSYSFDVDYDNNLLEFVSAEVLLMEEHLEDDGYNIVTTNESSVRVNEIAKDYTQNVEKTETDVALAKLTFKAKKTAALGATSLTAAFVGTDDFFKYAMVTVLENGEPADMEPGYEFLATPAVANTEIVLKENLMELAVAANRSEADRGDEVVLSIGLNSAVPFNGMRVDIPVDPAVFEVVNATTTIGGATAMAGIVGNDIRLYVVNSANMSGVTELATVTLKVKDTAPFGKTALQNAFIAEASEYSANGGHAFLTPDADYAITANLNEVTIVCGHSTATSNGDKTHSCNAEGCTDATAIPCTAATLTEYQPTCTAEGYIAKICVCGYQWNDPSGKPALGHDLTTVHAGGAATGSQHTAVCSRGDYAVTEGCTFTEVITTPATCLANAKATATCNVCGYSYEKEILNSKVPHTQTRIRYYAPTETVEGKWSYYCDICKDWATNIAIPAGHPFPDVKKPSSWIYDGVLYSKIIGVVSGDQKGNFNPNNNITRAEVATILVRYLGYEAEYKDLNAVEFETYLNNLYAKTGVTRKTLTDLQSNKWFYRATSVACALGIFQGDNNNKFNPNNNISRQEFCLVLYRLYKDAGLKIDVAKTYTDIAKVPSWSKNAVLWAGSVGLFNGDQKGNFNATQNATRAQVAALMMRIDVDIRDIEVM